MRSSSLSLAKYAAAGLPKAYLIEPEDGVADFTDEQNPERKRRAGRTGQAASEDARPTLAFELDDGLRSRKSWGSDRQMILTDSIAVRVDGQRAGFAFSDDGERYLLTVSLPDDLEPGEHAIEIHFQNMNKNSVLNPHFNIEVE